MIIKLIELIMISINLEHRFVLKEISESTDTMNTLRVFLMSETLMR